MVDEVGEPRAPSKRNESLGLSDGCNSASCSRVGRGGVGRSREGALVDLADGAIGGERPVGEVRARVLDGAQRGERGRRMLATRSRVFTSAFGESILMSLLTLEDGT